MPLHNAIPLCNVKYVRDIYSSATFIYDTTAKINKDEGTKAAVIEKIIEIDKITSLNMCKESSQIDKLNVERSLMDQPEEININGSQCLEAIRNREINLSQYIDVEKITSTLIDYNQNTKNLELPTHSGMNKASNLNVEIDRTEKNHIDKIHNMNLVAALPIELYKNHTLSMGNDRITELSNHKYDLQLEFYHNYELNKCDAIHYIDRLNESEIIKDHTSKMINRVGFKEINSNNSQRCVIDESVIGIGYVDPIKNITNDTIIPINQYIGAANIERISESNIDKDKTNHYLFKLNVKDISCIRTDQYLDSMSIIDVTKFNERLLYRQRVTNLLKTQENYLDRLNNIDISKIQGKQMDRNYINDMFKIESISLDENRIIDIDKEHSKQILDLSIEEMYKMQSRSLGLRLTEDIYLQRANKFIEVTKRWWWLNESTPKDHLIIPNKDYGSMIDLLNNDDYEYLRYTNHPIDWGKNWGIDKNIPPAAISIEIMLDLVNIINMVLHKNAQGWASVSGKEAIQLLMELIYDWYTMSTSKPNHSYYRAYRWIRWEAEKVYFINSKNGLAAIETLVMNLMDYLKIHHFNNVPTWSNPETMDEGRNFNRLAQNGDLMKPLDKIKGKRHYYIETQNFERQNKLVQAKM